MTEIGQVLEGLRIENEVFFKKDWAEQIGIHPRTYLYVLESKRPMTIKSIEKICKNLKMKRWEFFELLSKELKKKRK